MKKKYGYTKVVAGVIVALVVAALTVGCSSGGSSSKPSESEAKQEQQAEPEAKVEAEKAPEPEPEPEPAAVDETLIRPEFKEAMDSYEAFFNEYVEVMKAYQEDPTNAELMMRMADMMSQEADMIQKFDAWENEESMTTAETAYYLEVHSRIYSKLAEVM